MCGSSHAIALMFARMQRLGHLADRLKWSVEKLEEMDQSMLEQLLIFNDEIMKAENEEYERERIKAKQWQPR